MKVLLDASALIAMATNEDGAVELAEAIDHVAERLCCSVGVWEAARAVARKRSVKVTEATEAIDHLCAEWEIRMVPIGEREARIALAAHDRYGKGNGHPARLNMGDCFAYACAKANDARLLYKGDDFAHTDLA